MVTDRVEESMETAHQSPTAAWYLRQLGTPPPDIAGLWMADARKQLDSFAATGLDPENPVWEQFLVNESGRLMLIAEDSAHDLVEETDAESTEAPPLKRDRTTTEKLRPERKTLSKTLIAAGLIGVVAVAAAATFAMRNTSASRSTRSVATNNQADPFSPQRIEQEPNLPLPSMAPVGALETVMGDVDAGVNTSPTLMSDSGLSSDVLGGSFSLDSFMPSTVEANLAEEPTSDFAEPISVPENIEKTAPAAQSESPAIDINADDGDEKMLEDAVTQPTKEITPREVQTTAIMLPKPPSKASDDLPDATTLLAMDSPPANLKLEFPGDSALRLARVADQEMWQVTAGDDQKPIAMIAMEEREGEPGLQFRWLSAAAEAREAEALTHARLRSDGGDKVYLRGQFDADPIAMNLVSRDANLKWNLGGPLTISATRLIVGVTVPDDVSIEWLEPFTETGTLKSRGIAILTLKDSPEASALVLRIDVRTTSSLSMRLRYGGRLDPNMPWQWTDAKTIRSSLDSVTSQLQVADAQLLQLDAAISRAKRLRARRSEIAMEMQRDAIDSAVREGTLIAKRVAELDQLVALLDAGGRVTASLQVQWPGGDQQVLLQMDQP
jgi:hypothetical protein